MALTGFFLWLLFRHIQLSEVKATFAEANGWWLGAAVLAFYSGYACRIQRWRLMLLSENPKLEWKHCAGPLMASVAANNLLPLRAGDILRAFGFNRRLGITATTSLTTLLVERLLDLLMMVSLFGATLSWFGVESSRFMGLSGGILVVGSVVILFILLFPASFKPLASGLVSVATGVLPRLGHKLLTSVDHVFVALDHTSRSHTIIRLLFWSVLAWLFEGLVFWFAALSLPAMTQPLASWLALPVGTLATVIPSTPGFIGTFDYFSARAMTVLGNPFAAATAYALLVHALLWLPPTIAGGLYLLCYPVQNRFLTQTISQ